MTKPRVGFLGVGWIGRNRMEALAQSGLIEVVAVSDPMAENAAAAAHIGQCGTCESLDHLLDAGLDGLVIATPTRQSQRWSVAWRCSARSLSAGPQRKLLTW
jgi:predicted dehydrogenase